MLGGAGKKLFATPSSFRETVFQHLGGKTELLAKSLDPFKRFDSLLSLCFRDLFLEHLFLLHQFFEIFHDKTFEMECVVDCKPKMKIESALRKNENRLNGNGSAFFFRSKNNLISSFFRSVNPLLFSTDFRLFFRCGTSKGPAENPPARPLPEPLTALIQVPKASVL